jgi:hypothetical protein
MRSEGKKGRLPHAGEAPYKLSLCERAHLIGIVPSPFMTLLVEQKISPPKNLAGNLKRSSARYIML